MTNKSVPKGLWDQEVERACPRCTPIPYIPVEDKIGDAVKEASGTGSFKIKLPSGTKVTQSQWNSRNNKAFLIHVMSALSIIDRKGNFDAYKVAETKFDKTRKEAKVAKIIFDKIDPEASKNQKAQAKNDHNAKKALLRSSLQKFPKVQGECSHSMRIFLAITLGQNGTKL